MPRATIWLGKPTPVFYSTIHRHTDNSQFLVEHRYDLGAGFPWEEEPEKYGVVSGYVPRRPPRRGEWVLFHEEGFKLGNYYDYAATLRRPDTADWNSAARAAVPQKRAALRLAVVRDDYERLKAWGRGEWYYMGIVVYPLGSGGRALPDMLADCWRIESDLPRGELRSITDDLIRESLINLLENTEEAA